jgi:hypothetical protein
MLLGSPISNYKSKSGICEKGGNATSLSIVGS